MAFWKLRIDQLEPKERFVNSAMDEVYTAQSVKFLVVEFSTIISKNFKSMHPGMLSAKRFCGALMSGSFSKAHIDSFQCSELKKLIIQLVSQFSWIAALEGIESSVDSQEKYLST